MNHTKLFSPPEFCVPSSLTYSTSPHFAMSPGGRAPGGKGLGANIISGQVSFGLCKRNTCDETDPPEAQSLAYQKSGVLCTGTDFVSSLEHILHCTSHKLFRSTVWVTMQLSHSWPSMHPGGGSHGPQPLFLDEMRCLGPGVDLLETSAWQPD